MIYYFSPRSSQKAVELGCLGSIEPIKSTANLSTANLPTANLPGQIMQLNVRVYAFRGNNYISMKIEPASVAQRQRVRLGEP